MKTALVVSGGGSKGAFAVGVIQHMIEKKISFDVLVGTSTGSLIVAMLAAGRFDDIKSIYRNIYTRDLLKQNCWITLPWKSSLYNDKGLRKIIDSILTEYVFDDLLLSKKVVLVTTVNLNTGMIYYWSPKDAKTRDEYAKVLSASCNQPGLMPPRLLRDGDYHVDGGVREIAPLEVAAKCGAKKIYGIILGEKKTSTNSGSYNRIPKTLLRALNLMFHETRENDIKAVQSNKEIDLTIIRPDKILIENDLEFHPQSMREMMKAGYEKAQSII